MKTHQALPKIYFITLYYNDESKEECVGNVHYFIWPSRILKPGQIEFCWTEMYAALTKLSIIV